MNRPLLTPRQTSWLATISARLSPFRIFSRDFIRLPATGSQYSIIDDSIVVDVDFKLGEEDEGIGIAPFKDASSNFKEDEGCFVDAASAVPTIDFLAELPSELAFVILTHLSHVDLVTCLQVCKSWKRFVLDPLLWKYKFEEMQEIYAWKVRGSKDQNLMEAMHLLTLNEDPPKMDWYSLFRDRYRLQKRWDTGKGIKMVAIKGHADSVYCVQFDEEKIVTGSRDKTIKIWTHDGVLLKTLNGHTLSVLCLRYNKTTMVTGSSDQSLIVWRIPSEWNDDGKDGDKWNWRVHKRLKGHTMGVLDVEMSRRWIISCSKDTTIKVWDAATLQLVRTITGHHGPVNGIQLRGDQVVSASGDSIMRLWDIITGKCIRKFEGHERGLACVKYSTSDKYLATGSNDKTVKIWDVKSGECVQTLAGHEDLVRAVWFDDSRSRLVSASYDKSLKVWNTKTGELLMEVKRGHTSLVFDVTFDLRRIVSCSHDQKILVSDFGHGIDVSKYLS